MPDGQRIGADRLWDVLDAGISSKQPLGRILHQSLGAGPRGGGNLRKLRILLRREMYFHALKGTRTPGAQQHRKQTETPHFIISPQPRLGGLHWEDMKAFEATEKTRVRRLPKRAVYDRERIYSILDEGYVCHLGFVVDDQPYVIPTGYARVQDSIYIHGSAASRMIRTASGQIDVCVTVTLIDGLVLARSAFHHSMNYRSVVLLGKARLVTERDEKRNALRAFTDHIVPGRWDEVRPPTEQELNGTSVLAMPIDEASAKVRTGPPVDDAEDYALPVWAGVIPVEPCFGEPVQDKQGPAGVAAFDMGRFRRR